MTIFNSLGSNYDLRFALRALVSFGDGRRELVSYLEKRYGGRAILTGKGRDALALGLRALLGKHPSVKVAINGFTCIALYDAVVRGGYTPVFLDIDEGALDFSPETLRAALEHDENIKAVVLQNTLGVPCRAKEIAALCRERNVFLIEDLAHSIGARYEDGTEAGLRHDEASSGLAEAGTLGEAVIFSFGQDKVVDAVSGGALVMRGGGYDAVAEPVHTPPFRRQFKERIYPSVTWKIRFWYGLGIGKPVHALARALGLLPRPLDGDVEPRTMPSWQAALVMAQLARLEETAAHRRAIAEVYARELPRQIQVPRVVAETGRSANLRFPIIVEHRDALIAYLRARGMYASDIWYDAPIAPKKYAGRTSYKSGTCPRAESVAEKIVNLPTHINVSPACARKIAGEVNGFLQNDHGIHG